eukprot:2960645-Prymnesium_polylepis.2
MEQCQDVSPGSPQECLHAVGGCGPIKEIPEVFIDSLPDVANFPAAWAMAAAAIARFFSFHTKVNRPARDS